MKTTLSNRTYNAAAPTTDAVLDIIATPVTLEKAHLEEAFHFLPDLQKDFEEKKKEKATKQTTFASGSSSHVFLTREEEKALLVAFQENGDLKARDKLIVSHMPLVFKMASRFKHRKVDFEDLVSEGVFGLIRAAEKFDIEKNLRFNTYAVWWVRAFVVQFMLENWSIVRPASLSTQKKLFFQFEKKKNELFNTQKITSMTEEQLKEMAKTYGVSTKSLKNMEKHLHQSTLSLDEPMEGGDSSMGQDSSTRLDSLADKNNVSPEEKLSSEDLELFHKKLLDEAFGAISTREKNILSKRWLGENRKTLQELADEENVSRERIRQIESRALAKLKRFFSEQKTLSKEDILAFT